MADAANLHRPMQIVHNFSCLHRTGDFRIGLAALQSQGIGGIVTNVPFKDYMIHESDWTQLVQCVRACRELGMRVWLYDEMGYPSFFAGGQVLRRRPDLEAVGLYYDETTGAMAADKSYEGTHNCNNYFADARTPNLLEPATAEEFLKATHEKYARWLSEDLAAVEAFFTDEPALNVLYFPSLPQGCKPTFRFDPPDANRVLRLGVPWSSKLAAEFNADTLTGLFRDMEGSADLRQRFYGRIAEHMAQECFGPLQTWCRAHNVACSGHLLCEENTFNHVPLYGNFLRCLMRLDIPGIDVLSADPMDGWEDSQRGALLAASAAMLNGTRRVFSEASDHTQRVIHKRKATAAEASASLAWQAALGVTDFTYYFSWGVCEPLNGKSFESLTGTEQAAARSPDEFRSINESITRLLTSLDGTQLAADVFLYYPIEQLQAEYRPLLRPWENDGRPAEARRISRAYHQAVTGLLDAGIIPCLIDGPMLRDARRTRKSAGADRLNIGKASAAAIVYPAGCQPAARFQPQSVGDPYEYSAELPARLLADGKARLLKDNPKVAAGVMIRDGHSVVTLVNLTADNQTCCLRTVAGKRTMHLPPYEWLVEVIR